MDGPLMRKVNGKLFLLLLIGGVLLTGAIFTIHYFQYQRIGSALLFQARRAEEQGQMSRSVQYLQRYIEFNPRDVAEKANLARLWTSDAFAPGSRVRDGAIRLLDDVLLHEDNPELRRLLVKTALEQRNYKLARDHIGRLLDWKKVEQAIAEDRASQLKGKPLSADLLAVNKSRGEFEGFWGQILEADKRIEEALSCYRLAILHAPDIQLPYVRLSYQLRRYQESDPTRRAKNHEQADQIINDLVGKNASSFEAYLSRWRYRRDFDLVAVRENGSKGQINLDSAAEDVTQALKRQPESLDVLLAAADLERLRGRVAADMPNRTPEQRRQRMKEHRSLAADYLRRGLDIAQRKKLPSNDYAEFQLLWHKGNLLLDDLDMERVRREQENLPDGDDKAAREEIAQVVELVHKTQMPAAADYMRGRLLIHEHKWADAAVLFEKARNQLAPQPDLACQANLYLGQCYEKLEQHALMYNAFKRVIEWDPTSVPALMGMASARWSQGQLENAVAQYDVIMKQRKVPPRGWIDIARLELQRQSTSEKPDWKGVETALSNAMHFFPEGNVEITLLNAEVLLRKKKVDEARQQLESARDKNPTEPEYWTALIDLALQQKQPAQARILLEQAQEKIKDHVSLRLAETRILLVGKQNDLAAKIRKLGENRKNFTDREQARLLSGLAEALFRLGKPAQARKLWEQVAAMPRHGNNIRLQQLLFDLAMRDNDAKGMEKAIASMESIEQRSGTYHRYGEALYLIWQAKQTTSEVERSTHLQKARLELDSVARLRPSWPPVFVARAEIAELNGNPEQAIKDLQQAMTSGDSSPTTVRRLVGLLTKRGRDEEAQFLLTRVKPTTANNADLGRLAVAVAVRRGELRQAVEMAQNLVQENSRDPNDLIWMARVLATAKKYSEAEKKLGEAMRVVPADPMPYLTMVQLLKSQDREKEALEIIQTAEKQLPKDKSALTMARCYQFLGDTKKSLEYFNKAFEQSKNDPVALRNISAAHLGASRTDLAEPVLRRMLSKELKKVDPDDLAWARRSLAVVLAAGTDYKRFIEALDLVGLKLDSAGRLQDEPEDENTENRRARARVLSSQNQKQFRQKAIAMFLELERNKALTPDDEFLLALLYEKDGDIRKSEERLKSLVTSRAPLPQYLAQYGLSIITHRRQSDAIEQAEKIATKLAEAEKQSNVGPNSFASIEIKVRCLEAKEKGDEALKMIREHVQRKDAKPEEVVLVVSSCRRLKRYKEAFDLCVKTWEEGKCSPEVLGSMSVGVLRFMSPSDAQVKTIETYLKKAIEGKPDSVALMMHLSDLYDQRGKYAEASKLYRKVLQKEPNNFVALNNLAWLLAHQTGEAEEALNHINRAVKGMGRRPDLLDTRGLVHLALKETNKALEDLTEATNETPTANRLYHLARALHEDRNRSKAREILQKAKEKGLQVSQLHPVEQGTARELLQEYGLR